MCVSEDTFHGNERCLIGKTVVYYRDVCGRLDYTCDLKLNRVGTVVCWNCRRMQNTIVVAQADRIKRARDPPFPFY